MAASTAGMPVWRSAVVVGAAEGVDAGVVIGVGATVRVTAGVLVIELLDVGDGVLASSLPQAARVRVVATTARRTTICRGMGALPS
jgi:hypothetical protein